MTAFPRGFGPDDLPPASEVAAPEIATSLGVGRQLDAFAAADRIEPRADFTARVMTAIAAEPAPQPAAVAGDALRRGRPLALVAALGDAWRVTFSGGRPVAMRAQALAFVLVAAIAIGSIGGLIGVGASGLFNRSDSGPTPEPSPVMPSPLPSPSPTVSPSISPSPTPSPTPTPTPTPTPSRTPTDEPTETAEPTETEETETPRPGESDNSGPGGGDSSGPGEDGGGG